MEPSSSSTRSRRGACSAAAAALAIALLIGATVAVARGGTLAYPRAASASVRDQSFTSPVPVVASKTCPKHFVAVGGGAHITGKDPDFDLEIQSTGPHSGGGTSWVNGIDNNTGFTGHVASFVICERGDSKQIKRRVATRLIASGGEGTLSVSCPHGTKVTGGGAGITGNHQNEVSSSQPADGKDADTKPNDGWSAVVNNGSSMGSQRMTVTAVCSKLGKYKVVHTGQVSLPDNHQVAATAPCPGGSQVTGGGLSIRGFDDGYEAASSFPIDGSDHNKLPDDGWRGIANNDGQRSGPDPRRNTTMQTWAVCKTA